MARRKLGAGTRGRASTQAEAERQGAFKGLPVPGYFCVFVCAHVPVYLSMSVP